MAEPADLIAERRKTYGDFEDVSRVAQNLKVVMNRAVNDRDIRGQAMLSARQYEALDSIASKIARILVGDPNHADSWDDIAGYAKLGGTVTPETMPERHSCVCFEPETLQHRTVLPWTHPLLNRRSGAQRRVIVGIEMQHCCTALSRVGSRFGLKDRRKG